MTQRKLGDTAQRQMTRIAEIPWRAAVPGRRSATIREIGAIGG